MLSINDDRIVAKCYVELADVTKEKGDYDESLHYHRKSMEIFERMDDPLSVADSHLNIADVYKAKGELKQAMNEYEKGLSLYEDVLLDDPNKNSDSATDNSLNSSSMSDLQHAKALSKSEEVLSRSTGMIDDIQLSSSPKLRRGDSDQHLSNTSLNQTDVLRKTSSETTMDPMPIEIFEPCPSIFTLDEEMISTVINSSEHAIIEKKISPRQWDSLFFKRTLICITLLCFTGAFLWSMYSVDIPLTRGINDDDDDLTEQLRKFLSWRTDRWLTLTKTHRRTIEEFLRHPDTRLKISLDKFQRILDLLDLKMVLIPR